MKPIIYIFLLLDFTAKYYGRRKLCLQTKIDNTTTGTEFDCAEIFISYWKKIKETWEYKQ